MSELDYPFLLQQLLQPVRQAGELVRHGWHSAKEIRFKGRIDLVTETDLEVENFLRAELSHILPEAGFLAEETASQSELGRATWIVDPLDGTVNFAHQLQHVAISIALWHQEAVQIGVVSLPILGETFTAVRGQGAWLNQSPIQTTATANLEHALLATGFPYNIREELDQVIPCLKAVLSRCRGVRRLGAAAVDLAYTACGRLDGFYEMGLKPWDTAAGWLLVEEAGGAVTRLKALEPYSLFSKTILATNGALHADVSRLLDRALAETHSASQGRDS